MGDTFMREAGISLRFKRDVLRLVRMLFLLGMGWEGRGGGTESSDGLPLVVGSVLLALVPCSSTVVSVVGRDMTGSSVR